MYKEHKILMICKKNNIADINEFKAFYHQYKKYYNIINLIKAYKNIFLYMVSLNTKNKIICKKEK